MRVFFIGFGQAGGKIVDMFLAQDRKLGSTSFRGIVINTARTDLMGVKYYSHGGSSPHWPDNGQRSRCWN